MSFFLGGGNHNFVLTSGEQTELKHLMNHVREGDEYVFFWGGGNHNFVLTSGEQAEVKHLMNHVREGDEYVFFLGRGGISILYLLVVNSLKFQ